MKGPSNKYMLIMALAFSLALGACSDDPYRSGDQPYISVDPSKYSDFNTVFDCPVTIEFDHHSLISVYDVDPEVNPEAEPIYAAFTDNDGKYSGVMQLPTAYIGKTLWAKGVSFDCASTVEAKGVKFKSIFNPSRAEAQLEHMYTDEQLHKMCKELYDKYIKRLPEGKNNSSKLSETSNLAVYTIKDNTEIICSFVNSGGRYVSQLYYFYFPKDVNATDYMRKYVKDNPESIKGVEKKDESTQLRTAFMRLFTQDSDNDSEKKFLLTKDWGVIYTGRSQYKPSLETYSKIENNNYMLLVFDKDKNRLSGNGFLNAETWTTDNTETLLQQYKDACEIAPLEGGTVLDWQYWIYLGNGFVNRNFNNQIGAHHHLKYYGNDYKGEGTYMFPKDMRIGFILKVLDTDKLLNKKLSRENSIHMLTTNNELNKGGAIQCARNLQIIANDDEKEITNVVYGFEDALLETNPDKDYNDFMFMVTATPELSTAGIETFEDEGKMKIEGTLLYEDLYPAAGDYDMNDVIVEYQMNVTFDKNNFVTGLDCCFYPTNYGATYDDDLYMEFRVGDKQVLDPTLLIPSSQLRALSSQNLSLIKAGNRPTGVVEKHFDIDASKKIHKDSVKIKNLNPFIYVHNTNHEVHLVNGRFCGVNGATQNGLTEGQKKYYPQMLTDHSKLESCYFPYAMHVPVTFIGYTFEGFTPVTETINIIYEYRRFLDWMIDPKTNTDWYRTYEKWVGTKP